MTVDEALRIIESKSVHKVSAVCDDGSAFLIPVGPNDVAYAGPERFTKAKLLKYAAILETKPS